MTRAEIMPVLDWCRMDTAARAATLARPALEAGDELAVQVRHIMQQVRTGGDAALRTLTHRFDGADLEHPWVPPAAIARAETRLPADLRAALTAAIDTVTRFHRAGLPENRRVETAPGVVCASRWLPLSPVGLYVPAGSAPLPSTAIMLAVPAVLAGCDDIVIATPPNENGEADPAVLAVATSLNIDKVLLAGGAQAIAAMAYGTESVPKAVKIFGPGNRFVAEAKRQAAEDPNGAAMDLPAGPSEVMVIADASARPDWVAVDLLSQAEHGPDSQVFLLTDDQALPERVAAALTHFLNSLPRAAVAREALATGAIIRVPELSQAVDIANGYAPEHLILAAENARALLDQVTSAGSVFLGYHTPEALGDYISGTNHVLPTGGWARAYGGLSVTDFMRRMTVQEATPEGLAALGPAGARIAAHEGLEAHRQAITLRMVGDSSQLHANHPEPKTENQKPTQLARPEIRALEPYASARCLADDQGILLNANENPWPPDGDGSLRLNRYPDPQPAALVQRLAEYYGVRETQILVTRGSDEGIDLLVRVFCRAGQDRVLVCPPCFGMYALCARVQGAEMVAAPLVAHQRGFTLSRDAAVRAASCKLAFLCSPNNPTGDVIGTDAVRALAGHAGGLVVVDEAYQEFSARDSAVDLIGTVDNLVVLRTLSKAFALAGCRIGVVIAHPEIIGLLKRILPPYPLPASSVSAALSALTPAGIERMREQVRLLREEKRRLCGFLEDHPAILRLWPGEANFVLVQVEHAADFVAAAADAGIRLRDQSYQPGLENCVRITVGTPAENDALRAFIIQHSSFIIS